MFYLCASVGVPIKCPQTT